MNSFHFFNTAFIMKNANKIRRCMTEFDGSATLPTDLLEYEHLCFISMRRGSSSIQEIHAYTDISMCLPIHRNPFIGMTSVFFNEVHGDIKFDIRSETIQIPKEILTNTLIDTCYNVMDFVNVEANKRTG